MDYLQAVRILRPGTHWSLSGETLTQYEGEPQVTPPTKEEVQAVIQAHKYKQDRAVEYPPLVDQVEALMKGGKELEDMKTLVDSVRQKYPKPV